MVALNSDHEPSSDHLIIAAQFLKARRNLGLSEQGIILPREQVVG